MGGFCKNFSARNMKCIDNLPITGSFMQSLPDSSMPIFVLYNQNINQARMLL